MVTRHHAVLYITDWLIRLLLAGRWQCTGKMPSSKGLQHLLCNLPTMIHYEFNKSFYAQDGPLPAHNRSRKASQVLIYYVKSRRAQVLLP